jgi:hypothetical protein
MPFFFKKMEKCVAEMRVSDLEFLFLHWLLVGGQRTETQVLLLSLSPLWLAFLTT